jgi:hypothetical protein
MRAVVTAKGEKDMLTQVLFDATEVLSAAVVLVFLVVIAVNVALFLVFRSRIPRQPVLPDMTEPSQVNGEA